jgi:tetratricopeptide (TPR) repeat protein
MNMRREALIAMLDSLIPEVAGKVTSREYASVAYALERYGDLDMAAKYWQLAVNIAPPNSVARVLSLRGLGGFTLDRLGDQDKGREILREAIDIASKSNNAFRHEHSADLYFVWAHREDAMDPQSSALAELLAALRAEIGAIGHCVEAFRNGARLPGSANAG